MATKISLTQIMPDHQTVLEESSKLLEHTYDVSEFAIKGADNINFPTLAARSAQVLAIGASGTSSNLNYGNDTIALDKKLFDAWAIKADEEAQNVMRSEENAIRRALAGFGVAVDDLIYDALIAAAQASGRNVVKTSDIYADLVDIQKKLNDAKVPSSDRVFIANTTDYATLLKTKDFVRFDSLGKENITEGAVGKILGFTVVLTTVADGDSVAYWKGGIATGFQTDASLMEVPAPLSTSTQYSLHQLMGLKVLQVSGGNSSPFVVRYGANPS